MNRDKKNDHTLNLSIKLIIRVTVPGPKYDMLVSRLLNALL